MSPRSRYIRDLNLGEISLNIYEDIVFIRYIMVMLTVTLTFDLWSQKLISTTTTKIGWNSLHWFLRYGVRKVFWVIACCDLDLWLSWQAYVLSTWSNEYERMSELITNIKKKVGLDCGIFNENKPRWRCGDSCSKNIHQRPRCRAANLIANGCHVSVVTLSDRIINSSLLSVCSALFDESKSPET